MTINRKVTGTAMSMPAGVGIGLGSSLLVTVLGCALVAWLLAGEKIPESGIGYGAMTILLIGSLFGAITAALLVKHRKLLVCMTVGLLYLAVLLLINGLAFGGNLTGLWVTVLLILGGASAAGLITARQGKGVKKGKLPPMVKMYKNSTLGK